MNWKTLKSEIYYWDGSWRDIYVKNTKLEDWKRWIDLVNENYRIDWYNGKTNLSETKIKVDVIKEYWNGNGDLCSTANVYLDNLQLNAHFFDESEIENDIDPREFKSLDDHEKLIEYLKAISKVCKKEVIVTPENCPEFVLIRVNGDNLELLPN